MARRKRKEKDPYLSREAEKYDRPIASREYLIEIIKDSDVPMGCHDIAKLLKLKSTIDLESLGRRLRAMVRDAQLLVNGHGTYEVLAPHAMLSGRIITDRDHLWVDIHDHSLRLALSREQAGLVYPGDEVTVKAAGMSQKGLCMAELISVDRRNTHELIGRFHQQDQVNYVVPENRAIRAAIIIPEVETNGYRDGQSVVVEIIAFPTERTQAIGRLIEAIGDSDTLGPAVRAAIMAFEIPYRWPEFDHELSALPNQVDYQDDGVRKDLRSLDFVTIDGEDAKDFDDAVYAESKKGGGWMLYVAIADVSHYVKDGSPLDQEAQLRGNSVYFPEQVVPMLPEELSNELCSLKPKVDRLVMVCEMNINAEGQVKKHHFYPAVICSKARLTYNQVEAYISEVKVAEVMMPEVLTNLTCLYNLFQVLHSKRLGRGALEINTVEPILKFSPDGKVTGVGQRERNDAHRLIEECMLLANVSAAEFLQKEKLPGLYRIHEGPPSERLESLRESVRLFGLNLKSRGKISGNDLNRLLQEAEALPACQMVQLLVLRSLCQALYSPDNIGHFGLAFEAYTHFTSPIRRYADLMVHRIIKAKVTGEKNASIAKRYDETHLKRLGEELSIFERRADEATRDVNAAMQCAYMSEQLGDHFKGVVTTVKSFGCFVEIIGTQIDGLIHISSLVDDYYVYDEQKSRLSGEVNGRTLALGDVVEIKLNRVDIVERKIDFLLLDQGEPLRHKRVSRRSRRRA